MNKTKIEYLTHTWNPLAMRCTPISKGCENCWHLRMADRLAKNPVIPEFKRNIYGGGYVAAMVDWNAPMKRKKPAVIGVQFMGDLGHESVEPLDFDLVFNMMGMCQQHTFVVLTKRPERVRKLLEHFRKGRLLPNNIWLGVTVEDQETADERLPELFRIPSFRRWMSYEPALGPVELPRYALHNQSGFESDWLRFVVAGGESGPGARPAHPDWFRSVRDQCEEAGVPFMFKQWGAWEYSEHLSSVSQFVLGMNKNKVRKFGDGIVMTRVGAKNAGRTLDGREHMETPWEMPE